MSRFRAIRTFDLTVHCFPERQYKAALTAAQRAMRALKKADFVRMYRTDRLQHIAGLTKKGADWLNDRGVEGQASVRRVADMSNPEHSLWANFLVLCCQARGLQAENEAELLRTLNPPRTDGKPRTMVQGALTIKIPSVGAQRWRALRPDALAFAEAGRGPATWFEIDRSKRGADRELSLQLLFGHVGSKLVTGHQLSQVVVFAKTRRIELRALDLARKLVLPKAQLWHGIRGKFALQEIAGQEGTFEVWRAGKDARGDEVPKFAGHVIIQLLPLWLPRVRLDGRAEYPLHGWMNENYLPYRRPPALGAWPAPDAPWAKV